MIKIDEQAGMTLVELLISIIIFGILSTAIYNIFKIHNLMAARQEERTNMQQELLSSIVQISEDLRMCGYKFTAAGSVGFLANSTNATSIYCTKEASIFSNSTDIGYTFIQPNREIIFFNNATASWENAANNIENLTLRYMELDGSTIPAITNATVQNIRSIEISITAAASEERSKLNINDRTMSTMVFIRNAGLD